MVAFIIAPPAHETGFEQVRAVRERSVERVRRRLTLGGLSWLRQRNIGASPSLAGGSLPWDKRPSFDEQHDDWQFDGPALPPEFSRVSPSRIGVLTLVIGAVPGTSCPAAYAIRKRRNPGDAIADLQRRESTIMRHMGFYFHDGSRRCVPPLPETIAGWAAEHDLDVVVWTGLQGNFREKVGEPFSVEAPIRHDQGLPRQ